MWWMGGGGWRLNVGKWKQNINDYERLACRLAAQTLECFGDSVSGGFFLNPILGSSVLEETKGQCQGGLVWCLAGSRSAPGGVTHWYDWWRLLGSLPLTGPQACGHLLKTRWVWWWLMWTPDTLERIRKRSRGSVRPVPLGVFWPFFPSEQWLDPQKPEPLKRTTHDIRCFSALIPGGSYSRHHV